MNAKSRLMMRGGESPFEGTPGYATNSKMCLKIGGIPLDKSIVQ